MDSHESILLLVHRDGGAILGIYCMREVHRDLVNASKKLEEVTRC